MAPGLPPTQMPRGESGRAAHALFVFALPSNPPSQEQVLLASVPWGELRGLALHPLAQRCLALA